MGVTMQTFHWDCPWEDKFGYLNLTGNYCTLNTSSNMEVYYASISETQVSI